MLPAFPYSLTKAAPIAELRMGAHIRGALEERGIAHRVTGGAVAGGHVVTTTPGQPQVWITAHDADGHVGYDAPWAGLIGVTATVTDEHRTRIVYDGIGTGLTPVALAEACARVVATFLGVEPRVCPSCMDYGLIDIHHPSTDAVISHQSCPDENCRKRMEARYAAHESVRASQEQHTYDHDHNSDVPYCADCPPF